jgi:Tfp pilus assembly protein FimT
MRATRVTVCTSNNMTSCTNDGWAQGRLVFVDGGAIRTIDGADLVLVRTNAPPVTASGAGVALVNAVSFQANGRLNGVGRINVCADGQRQRRIDLTRAGLATLNRTNIAC